MIKDYDKKNKIKPQKTAVQILIEYLRTALIAFGVALVFTTFLTIHARNDMIKNLYAHEIENKKIDEQIARQIVSQAHMTKNITLQNYTVCMQIGNLYEAAKDYPNAQFAYKTALEKAKKEVYTPYYKLSSVLIAQGKFDEAEDVINSVEDVRNVGLIKFKTKAYIETGDKYYSIGKFLKAAKNYEKANYYYNRLDKKDKIVEESIIKRIINSYSEAATIVVQQGFSSDAVRFLKKAEAYAPNNFHIKYKLAIIYSDLDPIESIKYFEPLLKKMPQYIDYSTLNKALLKAANIAELEGDKTLAKYYRYKSHSIDLLIKNKVIYKNDIDITLNSFDIRKIFFRYKLNGNYTITNLSANDIPLLYTEFILKYKDEIKETNIVKCVSKNKPLLSNGGKSDEIKIKFGKNIFTKKELSHYKIEVYAFKDEKFKTLIGTFEVPTKSIKNNESENKN